MVAAGREYGAAVSAKIFAEHRRPHNTPCRARHLLQTMPLPRRNGLTDEGRAVKRRLGRNRAEEVTKRTCTTTPQIDTTKKNERPFGHSFLRRVLDYGPIFAMFLPFLHLLHTANNAIHNEISRELIYLFPSQSSHTILSVPYWCNFFRAKMHQKSVC